MHDDIRPLPTGNPDAVRPVKIDTANFGLACAVLQTVILFTAEANYAIIQTTRYQRRELIRYGITYQDNLRPHRE